MAPTMMKATKSRNCAKKTTVTRESLLSKMAPVHSTLAATPSETAGPATEANTDFDVFILDESDIDDVARNAYVKELADKSVLNILQPKRVKNAFNEKDERENRLFQLFLSNPLWEAILVWTNEKLVSTGKSTSTRTSLTLG
jgi:hypothetical protein